MSKILEKPEYLFDQWDRVSEEIKDAKHIIVLLDFDGTLVSIVPRPQYAVLSKSMKNILICLAKRDNFSLGIISGRSLKDIEKLIDIRNVYYAGNHGLEIKGSEINFSFPGLSNIENILKDLNDSLEKAYKTIDGVIIENKGFSLSVHYRLVKDENVKRVKEIFDQLTRTLVNKSDVRLMSGKKVLEVLPLIDWNKGKAVKLIEEKLFSIKNIDKKEFVTIYMGDDKTDEHAFEELLDKGISICVGNVENSKAKYFVNDTAEVENFLLELTELK